MLPVALEGQRCSQAHLAESSYGGVGGGNGSSMSVTAEMTASAASARMIACRIHQVTYVANR
jgi:hypothetical protein